MLRERVRTSLFCVFLNQLDFLRVLIELKAVSIQQACRHYDGARIQGEIGMGD